MAKKDPQPQIPSPNINVDPVRTPILYADFVYMKANEHGIVLDFAQQLGPSNQYTVVSRIGISKDHARSLIDHLEGLLRSEGISTTREVD